MSTSFSTRLAGLAGLENLNDKAEPDGIELSGDGQANDDAKLMLRVQKGNVEALSTLYDRYSYVIRDIGAIVLRDQMEAEDLVQEVYLQIYKKCESFDPRKGNVRTWLRTIAFRLAFNRKYYLSSRRFYDSRAIDDVYEQLHSSIDLQRETERRYFDSVLMKAFESLPERQRVTLELSFFEGHTLREISEITSETLATVRHHYYRGIEKIRNSLPVKAARMKRKL